jgi:hypothetical protein
MSQPTLHAGTARTDLTPDWPVMLAGFGQRTAPATTAHDPVLAKALYLEQGGERLLIVTADLLSIPGQVGTQVAAAIGQATGLAPRQIMLCASHTHSAPTPGDAGDGATGVARFEAHLIQRLAALGIAATRAARPARLRTAIGRADIFFNRRAASAEQVDPRVPVLLAETPAGAPLAVLFGAACHPTVLGWDNMAISADFTGAAQAAVERALPGATALFMNLAQGNIIPITSPRFDALDPRGYRGGTWEMAAALGERLAAAVLEAARAATPAEPGLAAARTDLALPGFLAHLGHAEATARLAEHKALIAAELGADFETRFPWNHLWSHASRRVIAEAMDEPRMRRLMIACCDYRACLARLRLPEAAPPLPVPVQLLRLAGLTLLALPGEVLVETGEAWRQEAGERAFIVACANAHHRYLPGRIHFAEPNAANRYETASAGLEEAAMDRIFAAARTMLEHPAAH